MDKKLLLTIEEANELSKLITYTCIISNRAIDEGYMDDKEIERTKARNEILQIALAKIMAQPWED